MKKLFILIMLINCMGFMTRAQIGINTDGTSPDNSAILDVKSTNKGFLPPRMNSVQRNDILLPVNGLVIYNTDCNDIQYYNGGGWIPMGNTGFLSTPGLIDGTSSPCANMIGRIYSIPAVPNSTGYQWSVPAGAVISSGQGTTAISVSFGTTGGAICVAAYNDCYRSPMNCLTVTINPVPSLVSVKLVTPFDCEGVNATFKADILNNVPEPAYQWSEDGNVVPGAINPTYTTASSSRVDCQVTPGSTCFSPGSNYMMPGGAVARTPLNYGDPIQLECNYLQGCSNPDATFHWENSSGSWTSSVRDPILYPQYSQVTGDGQTTSVNGLCNGEGYTSDVFYITLDYSPPPGSHKQGWICVDVYQ